MKAARRQIRKQGHERHNVLLHAVSSIIDDDIERPQCKSASKILDVRLIPLDGPIECAFKALQTRAVVFEFYEVDAVKVPSPNCSTGSWARQ